jgi:hypothetical protein
MSYGDGEEGGGIGRGQYNCPRLYIETSWIFLKRESKNPVETGVEKSGRNR